MNTNEGFINLTWDSFQANIPQNFQNVRLSHEFSDVTLACEDECLVKAHRIILASGSLFFEKLLSRLGVHPQPLLYLRGVTGRELELVLDFLYHGEARISQGGLQAFLGLAQELGVRGLMETGEEPSDMGERAGEPTDNKSIDLEEADGVTFNASYPLVTQKKTGQNPNMKDSSGDLEDIDEKYIDKLLAIEKNLNKSFEERTGKVGQIDNIDKRDRGSQRRVDQ